MDIKIRIYTMNKSGYTDSRQILLNEGELDDMIAEYLFRKAYIKDDEEVSSISYESVNL